MKKFILVSLMFILASFGAKAQEFLAGGGVTYGTFRETVGFDLRGDLRLPSGWSVVPHFTAYVPDKINNVKRGFREVNLDVHYLIDVQQLDFYPLAGLNFGTVANKNQNTGDIYRKTEIGINLGAGVDYFFTGRIAGLFETKYVVGDFDQWVLTFGVLFKLTN